MRLKEWLFALLMMVFIMAQVWMDLKIPDYMAAVTTLVKTPGSPVSEIIKAGGMMLLFAAGSMCMGVLVAVTVAKLSASFTTNLRSRLFRRVQRFTMAEMGGFSTASLITRSTNDITQVQGALSMGFRQIIKAPVMAIWAVGKIADKNSQWTFSTAAAVTLVIVLVTVMTSFALPKFRRMQELLDDLNRVTRENITGVRDIRAFNAENFQKEKYEDINTDMFKTRTFARRIMSSMGPSVGLIVNLLILAIYWIGAILVLSAAQADKIVLFSDMVVFSSYAMQVMMAFMMMMMLAVIMPRASVSAQRINEVLEVEPKLHSGPEHEGVAGKEGSVEFRDVVFQYPDAEEPELCHLSFTVEKGSFFAIIGATGSGKSTLINLIPRFYDVSQGKVLVNGRDVKEWDMGSLRKTVAYVAQKAVLFSGSVKDNLLLGKSKAERTDEELDFALRIASADEFVSQLEGGIDGHITAGGTNLSGGQKQRLSIARGLARGADILILDDSFSALDYRTDRAVRSMLQEECGDLTRIVVAQRIGTIRHADKILVLEDGRMAGLGTHDELMQTSEVYRAIAQSQLSEEELAR
jgi:ATP-binding cassette subfamily B protein